MKFPRYTLLLAFAASCAFSCCAGHAQSSFYQQFRTHNVRMRQVQPSWMSPLIQPGSRLSQAVRCQVSNRSSSGAHQIIYGGNQGINFVLGRRFQVELDPPSYFRNHSSTLQDGFGNAGVEVKARLASGNAEHGNYTLTAILYHGFAPRGYENKKLTGVYRPTLAGGHAFRHFVVMSTLGGILPTGKIAQQGRGIAWNVTAQVHPTARTWFDIENNTQFNLGGPHDSTTQNFITPAAFYMVRRAGWQPTHVALVFDGGMQIATTSYHSYNHNLITEVRIIF